MNKANVAPSKRVGSYQELLTEDSRPAPRALRKTGVTDIGPLEIPTSWYFDPEIEKLEVERIWKRSWQMVCREEDLSEVGDTWVYDVGPLSYVIVRSSADTIKAFSNSCLHRGRPLRDCPGHASQLKCPFHGFTWSLDGALRGVPSREEFLTITNEEFRLPEATVARWGGFVFINPDPNAEPFEDYIGDLTQDFEASPLEKKAKIVHISKVIPANWKVVNEAFLEAFHVHTTHPQWVTAYSDHLHQYDVFGNYSRIIIPGAVPSHQLRWTPSQQEILNCMLGGWDDVPPAIEIAPGANVRQTIADVFREQARPLLGDAVETISDAEMLDVVQYNLFPNFGPFSSPTVSLVYAFKPYGSDPLKSVIEIMLIGPWKGEGAPPRVKERRLSADEHFNDVPELGQFGAILNQDTANLDYIMRGIANNQRNKVVFASYHELKIRHFYHLYAQTMGLELPA
ncbi:MAG TPA: aromatic ring-hydroxylating dioxygenase subunit alpha [Phenylobacterium sp.]|uniref:aromatic ring-hydroxylating oxygenase subunit alpha n=1 Tax=Phenylobacterium sp. TaxID=1871053 RepID=UPI002B464C3B|nr:aromatic ring-hydroxylating dioxygenase subunit alpha [Phenylobacterium sp.]HKR87923.1 aromatic ring-hydroxylating dioxygenase subunit alpha [Phenylobacterium sp.]